MLSKKIPNFLDVHSAICRNVLARKKSFSVSTIGSRASCERILDIMEEFGYDGNVFSEGKIKQIKFLYLGYTFGHQSTFQSIEMGGGLK